MQPVANNMFKLIKKLFREISGIERREKDIDEFVNTIFQDINTDKIKVETIDLSKITVGRIDVDKRKNKNVSKKD